MAEESKTAPERPVFVDDLLPSAFHWAISRGLAVGLNDAGKAKHVPFTLTPTKVSTRAAQMSCRRRYLTVRFNAAQFPRKAFQDGLDLMRPFGVLVDKASRDVEWLVKTVEATAAADAFSGQLLKILRTVHAEGIAQVRPGVKVHVPCISVCGVTRLVSLALAACGAWAAEIGLHVERPQVWGSRWFAAASRAEHHLVLVWSAVHENWAVASVRWCCGTPAGCRALLLTLRCGAGTC